MPQIYQKENEEHLLESPELLEAPHHFYSSQNYEGEVRILMEWTAPARPFRKKDRSYYTTVATLIILISMIAVLAGEILLIGALFAIGFVVYVLNFVPPEDVKYKLSNQGITIGDHFYHWDTLNSFWFNEKEGHRVLNILTNINFPSMLILVLDGADEEEVKRICVNFLPFHEIAPRTIMDKWSEGLQKHFPLENPHH